LQIVYRNDLEDFCSGLKERGLSIVFTNGCFDLVHPGHIAVLQDAALLGDVLLVAINDDDSVRRLKGGSRPIMPAAERAEVLLAFRCVDNVTLFAEDTPFETIRIVKPDVLVKGAEYAEDEIVGAGFVKDYGGRVVRTEMKTGYSTRNLLDRILRS